MFYRVFKLSISNNLILRHRYFLVSCSGETRLHLSQIIYTFQKEFLKVFIEKKVFESMSLKRMRFFMILNLLPLIYIIAFSLSFLVRGIPVRLEDDYFIVFAHVVIAFLIYLYLDVLKKGKYVQEENDLTI